MNTISAIIIDSNKNNVTSFAKQLQIHCPLIEIIDEIYTPVKALATIQKKKPMCVFVDLKVNDTNAFEILKALHSQNLKVIITSLHENFALQAIHEAAFDYILKPVQQKNLTRMYERILRVYRNPVKEERSKIKFSTQERIHFVDSKEIIMAQAESNYTTLFLADNRKLFLSKTLKEVTNMLPKSTFLRIHNSYCVNLNHVYEYQKTQGGVVIMSNGKHATLSRNYKERFLESFA